MWVCITQRRKEGFFFFFFFKQVEERHRCYKLVWEGKKYQDNDKQGKQVSLFCGKEACLCACLFLYAHNWWVCIIHTFTPEQN